MYRRKEGKMKVKIGAYKGLILTHPFLRSYSELLSKFGDISFQEYVKMNLSPCLLWWSSLLRRVKDTPNFISSGSKIIKRLRRRQYDPWIIERTIGLVLGPSKMNSWYQEIFFDIKKYFLISRNRFPWYQEIEFLISRNRFLDIQNSISWYQEIINISWYQEFNFKNSRISRILDIKNRILDTKNAYLDIKNSISSNSNIKK